jgi:hypothetical protein
MPHAAPHRRRAFRALAEPALRAPTDPAREHSPEALFAALLDRLEEHYVRDGIRGVIRIVLASAALAPPSARGGAGHLPAVRAAGASRSDDEVFRTLVATLEEAFLRDGLDGVADALASIGESMVRAGRR